MVADIFSRVTSGALLATGGWRLGQYISDTWTPEHYVPWVFGLSAGGALLGLVATRFVAARVVRAMVRQVDSVPTSRLLSAIVGMVLGLLVAVLLSIPLSRISGWAGIGLPIALSLFLAYLGAILMALPERDVFQQLVVDGAFRLGRNGRGPAASGRALLDTSAIIDGRIAAIGHTGFLSGTLVVPQFVLDELRHVADSHDPMRRNRGRRGLEMLNMLREDPDVSIEILEAKHVEGHDVDAKLVTLAKDLQASILTTDYNLNRIAQIQGVPVLNVNDLANTLKPVVLPGEAMSVRIVQEGKEPGQGVGFMDDGTMVVVAGGQQNVDSEVGVQVTRVLQTAAGSIVFAQKRA